MTARKSESDSEARSSTESFSSLVLAARHLPNALFDNYDRCGAANDRARKLVRADDGLRKRMSFHTADVANLTDDLRKYDVVFLAALVGMAAEDKAKDVAHLGRHMADGAALVVRSAHGARGFLYPIVDPEDIRRRSIPPSMPRTVEGVEVRRRRRGRARYAV